MQDETNLPYFSDDEYEDSIVLEVEDFLGLRNPTDPISTVEVPVQYRDGRELPGYKNEADLTPEDFVAIRKLKTGMLGTVLLVTGIVVLIVYLRQ